MYQYLYKEKVDETCKCKTQWLYEHQRRDKKPLHGRSPEKSVLTRHANRSRRDRGGQGGTHETITYDHHERA